MSLALRGMHRDLREPAEFAMAIANHNGISPTVTSTLRTFTNQARLRRNFESCLASGRFPSAPNCLFPANRPGDSAHNFGLAFDSVVPAAQQATWDAIRQWVGWRVPSNDRIHAELPGWRQFVLPPLRGSR